MEIVTGSFEILVPSGELNAEDIYRSIEYAGRTCYQSQEKMTGESSEKFIRTLLARGHESVLEHISLSVKFKDVSRGFTHELVRHRLCTFSQESTRYVKTENLKFVMPLDKKTDNELFGWVDILGPGGNERQSPYSIIEMFESIYKRLLAKGWKPEDARQFLPIGTACEIVCTTNLREWRHIFKMRCDRHAHWEIRGVMLDLLKVFYKELPIIFEDLYKEFWQDGNI
jgi:thymidylate synthase (FAD)